MNRITSRDPLFVGISGGTGSGKSTLVRQIEDRFRSDIVTTICLDPYYRELGHLSAEERAKENFDAPSALDLELLYSHLNALRAGEPIDVPVYDFSLHTRAAHSERVELKPLVVLEGILALHDPLVRSVLELKIYLEVDPMTRFERRLKRDIRERGRSEDSVRWQWETTVQPMYLEYCEPSRAHADLVLNGPEDWPLALEEISRRLKREQGE